MIFVSQTEYILLNIFKAIAFERNLSQEQVTVQSQQYKGIALVSELLTLNRYEF